MIISMCCWLMFICLMWRFVSLFVSIICRFCVIWLSVWWRCSGVGFGRSWGFIVRFWRICCWMLKRNSGVVWLFVLFLVLFGELLGGVVENLFGVFLVEVVVGD